MADDRLIVVVGATGNQGGAVARALTEEGGWHVRGLSRDPGKPEARALTEIGVEMVKADLDDRSSLDRAFKDAYGVFSVQNFWTVGFDSEVRQGKNVADAARAAGVDHLVYSSVGAAERSTGLSHFESKWQIENYILDLGLPVTVFRPVFFMENFNGPSFRPALREGKLVIALRPETRLQMIALDDLGYFVAHALGLPQQFIGESIEIAGDELTMPQVAAAFSSVMGCPVEFVRQDTEEVRRVNAEWASMLEWFDREGYRADIPQLRQIHPGLLTLEQWIRKSEWVPVEARRGERPSGSRCR
jgi:uncharacterized protein YbjT (DUF2867 family)